MTTHSLNTDVVAPTFASPWANFAGGHQAAGYWKDPTNHVHLRGLVAAFASPPSTIFTLPVGFRPSAIEIFTVIANNAFGRIDIATTGVVQITAGNCAFVSLAGISFLADL